MFFFYLWTAFYAVSWNGTPWVVNSEAFPGAVRQVTQCLAASSNWLCEFLSRSSSYLRALTSLYHSIGNFVISRATPTMFLRMGNRGFGVYLFFATMQVLSIPFIVLLLPETRSVPLEAMDRLWAEKNTWRANSLLMAEASPTLNFVSLRNFRTDFFPMLQQLKREHQGDSKIATTSSDRGSSSQDVDDQKESV